jgi:hypothetical protein
MMAGACGSYSVIGGQHYIWPDYYQGPSFTFGEQHLTAPIQWQPNRSVPDLINCVNGTYIAPTFPWNIAGNLYDQNGFYNGEAQDNFSFAFQPTNFPQFGMDSTHGYPSDEYLTADQGVVHPLELSLQTVLSVSQAQRLAKLNLMHNRFQGTGTLEMSLGCYVMQPKDTFLFNYSPFNWVNKLLEVTATNFIVAQDDNSGAPTIRVSYTVRETSSTVYDWALAEELTVYDVPALPSQTPLTPAAPTDMTLASGPSVAQINPDGTVNNLIVVSWSTPLDNLAIGIQIQYQLVGASAWLSAPPADISLNSQWISNVVPGASYNVQIRSYRADGTFSAWLGETDYTVEATPTDLGTLAAQLPTITANSQLAGTVPGEMVTNGNFAAGLTGWTLVNGTGPLVLSTAEFHGATQSLELLNQTAQQVVTGLKAGRTYLLALWVMTNGSVYTLGGSPDGYGAGAYLTVSSGSITVLDRNSSGQNFGASPIDIEVPATAAVPWEQLQMAFTVSADCSLNLNLQNSIGGATVSATAWFDGVSLTDITTQSAQLGGVVSSLITPIANLMPSQAGADVTAQQPIVYTGASESIVPNGTFVLGNMQGWGGGGFTYGTDSFGNRIYAPPGVGSAFSPSFQVVPGAQYRLNFCVYNGTGSGGVYLRIAWQPGYTAFVSPVGDSTTNPGYEDFLSNSSVTTTPTVYSYNWTCPAGVNYASMCLYDISGSDLACQYVSCIPFAAAAQYGADVTSQNTSADTSAVDGVPSSTIAQVVPTGYKLYINSGARSYSITAI